MYIYIYKSRHANLIKFLVFKEDKKKKRKKENIELQKNQCM